MGTVSKKIWSNIHPCWDQCNGQRFLNELGAVTLILLHICSMISFGGFLEECLPCLEVRIDFLMFFTYICILC